MNVPYDSDRVLDGYKVGFPAKKRLRYFNNLQRVCLRYPPLCFEVVLEQTPIGFGSWLAILGKSWSWSSGRTGGAGSFFTTRSEVVAVRGLSISYYNPISPASNCIL